MNATRLASVIAVLAASLAVAGCSAGPEAAPTLERLEQLLDVSFPQDAKVIGGAEKSGSSLVCLVLSNDPLPIPTHGGRGSAPRRKPASRPSGTPFPSSSLLNLMASCQVAEDDVPRLAAERGVTHTGDLEAGQFQYREVSTQQGGWLTAIEIHFVQGASSGFPKDA